MSELNDLNLYEIKKADGKVMKVAVLFTLDSEYIETLSEKKLNRQWNTFLKKYGKDNLKKDYLVSTDKSCMNEKDVFYERENIAITGIESLTAIDERDKDNLEFGLRILNDDKLISLDESITRNLDRSELNKGLLFDEVEEHYNKLCSHLEDRVKESMLRKESETKKETINPLIKEQTDKAEKKETGLPEDIKKEITSLNKETQLVKENTVDKTKNKMQTRPSEALERNVAKPQDEKNNEKTPIIRFKDDLYNYIDKHVPEVNLSDIDVRNILSSIDYKGYKDLYIITQDSIEKKITHKERVLKTQRQKIVNDIYKKVEEELTKRYGSIANLINYKEEGTDFNHIYSHILSEYKKVTDSLETHRKQKELLLTEQYNIGMKEYVERKKRQAESDYEKANKHLIKNRVSDYVKSIKNEADNNKQNQILQLEDDIFQEIDKRNNNLVNSVIKDYSPSINAMISTFSEEIKAVLEEVESKITDEVSVLIDRIQDIEKKRIESEKLSDETIEAKVVQRTADYTQLRDKVSDLENEVFSKNKQLRDIETESMKKDSLLEKASDERSMLIKDKEYYRVEADSLKSEVAELRKLQIDSMKDFSVNPLANVRASTIEHKKNTGETITFGDRLASIDKKIYNLLSALLIGASLLGSAFVISGNNDEANSNQQEVTSLEETVNKQQKEIEEAKSVEENRQKEAVEQKEAKKEKDKDKK